MNSLKKFLIALVIVIACVGIIEICFQIVNKKNETSNNDLKNNVVEQLIDVSILVYDSGDNVLYNNSIKTAESKLANVLVELNDLDIDMVDDKYGAYIKAIEGVYQSDNYYWTYYINGEYAPVGVSSYEVESGDKISFKLEKFGEE